MSAIAALVTWIDNPAIRHTLIDQAAKVSMLLLVAWGMSWLLRRASASTRHQMWTAALLATLALPLLSGVMPDWRVPILDTVATIDPATDMGSPVSSSPLTADTMPAPRAQGLGNGVPTSASPSAATPATPQQALDVWTWAFLIWIAGVLLVAGRLLVSTIAAWRIARRSELVTDPDLIAEVATLSRRLGIRSPVHLVENHRITMPMAWGLLHQTVLLPVAARSWTEQRRRVVLLHELAHLKRRDCQTLWIARVAAALHWFNPLAWIAVRRLQSEREHACDDLVLTSGTPGPDYAQHLLDIARAMQSSLTPGWAMVAMARPSELEGRLLAILDPQLQRGRGTGMARWVGVTAILLLALPLASLEPRAIAEPSPSGGEPASAEAPKPSDNPRLLAAFAGALGDQDAEIRAQAAHSLGSIEHSGAVPQLSRAVRDDGSEEVRQQAAWALGMIESDTALPALRQAASDPSAEVRRQVAWALGMIESDTALPELRNALTDDDVGVREQAAWALGMIESHDAVDALGKALRDRESQVRKQAAWALGMIESNDAVDALTAAVKSDSSAEVRQQAAWALGMIGDPAALDALLDAMSDDDAEVQKQAFWAVGRVSE